MNQDIYFGLNHSVSEINRNFKIKVNGRNFVGRNMSMLVGVSGLIELVGIELANTLIDRAFDSSDDKIICKLRRGLKITFYYY